MNTKHQIILLIAFFTLLAIIPQQGNGQSQWTNLQGPPKAREVKDLAISSDGQTIYACDKAVLLKSTNGGTIWLATGSERPAPIVVTCKPSVPGIAIVGLVEGSLGKLYRSTSGGSDWGDARVSESSLIPLRIATSFVSSDNMYLGRKYVSGSTSFWNSSNGGLDWVGQTSFIWQSDLYAITPDPVYTQKVWVGGSDPDPSVQDDTDPNAPNNLSTHKRGVWFGEWNGSQFQWTSKYMGDFSVRAIAVNGSNVYAGTAGGNFARSTTSGNSWELKNQPASGAAITAIRLRTDVGWIYAATTNGIWRSTNNGVNWEDYSDGMAHRNVTAFVIVTSSPNVMFAATEGAVYKTTNEGDSWFDVSNGVGRMPLSSVTANGSNVWAVSNRYDTLSSYNGTVWSQTEASNFYGEHLLRNSSGTLFASGLVNPANPSAAYYRSTDGGATYNPFYVSATQGVGNVLKGSLVHPGNPAHTYVWGKDGGTNVYLIDEYGNAQDQSIAGGAYTVNDMVYPVNGSVVYYATEGGGVWRCLYGPCSGTNILSSMTIRSLALSSSALWGAGPNGLRRFNGSIWYQYRTDDLKKVIMRPGYPSSSEAVAVLTTDGNSIFYSHDGTASPSAWIDGTGNLPKPIYNISTVAGDATTVYAATERGVYKITQLATAPTLTSPTNNATGLATNVTLTWQAVLGASAYHVLVDNDPPDGNGNLPSPFINKHDVTTTSYQTAGLAYNTVYYWKVYPNNLVGDGTGSSVYSFTTTLGIALGVSPVNTDGSVCNTKVSNCKPKLTWTLYGITNNSQNPLNIYRYSCQYGTGDCGGPGSVVYTTTDGGITSWIDQGVTMLKVGQTPQTTYYYYATCAGYTSNKVAVNTNQVWKMVIDDPSIIPLTTSLEANYPNPFNPITTIRYSVAEETHVKIVIYDVLGREVEVLVDEHQQSGVKSVIFDASRLPSGVYFYRMTAGKFSDMKKMMLVK